MAYVRSVKTASGAIAVQIVWSTRRGSRQIEHLGSAHDEAEVAALKAAARQRLAEGQGTLDLGLNTTGVDGEPLEIVGTKASHLWDGLCRAYQVLGFDAATGGDEVFRHLVLARIIEPTSKQDSLRVLSETGVESVDYRTVTRRLPVIAKPGVRQALSAACAARAGLGPASLVLYDVSTLYFETDAGDGFREPGFSKERRPEPQITIGLLTDATGFPLAVEAFEGNKAETATMLPVINAFKTAHQLTGHVFTQPWPAASSEKARGIADRVIYYQYRHDGARRTLRGIDEQIAKPRKLSTVLTWLTFGLLAWLRVVDLRLCSRFGRNLNTKIGP